MTFNPASRDERMAACASRACALSVSFTCAPVSVPPRGMLSRMDFHCSLVRSLASWAACLTPERHQPDMYACARVMGSYISNRNVCAQTAQTWNLFNDDRCTLPENWTRMAQFDSEIPAQRARTIS